MQNKIKNWIEEYIAEYASKKSPAHIWQKPLISFIKADDARLQTLKQTVSPSHLMPEDLLPDARSVVVYFIPFNRSITASNKNGKLSSQEWAYAYIQTNKLIGEINHYLYEKLSYYGYTCSNLPATHNFDEKKLISNWSHRHIAQLAGLGSLGLHRLLITEAGCSGRLGSIVTNVPLDIATSPTPNYCLYYLNGSCMKCIERCPVKALTIEGFDRFKCYKYLLKNAEVHSQIGFADVCGKCISGVPCSHMDPTAKKL